MTVQQAARLLCCSPSTIYRWVTEHKIPVVRRGHRILFVDTDLQKWILNSRIPANEEMLFSDFKNDDDHEE